MASSKKNYITREWYEKLRDELRDLKEVKLPDILEKLAEAKAQWDLSENFEYKSAMEDKDFTNSRIADLEKLLANAEIIEEEKWSAKKSWEVDYGSNVTLSIEWDDAVYNVTIVWTWEVKINGKDHWNLQYEQQLNDTRREKLWKWDFRMKEKMLKGKT